MCALSNRQNRHKKLVIKAKNINRIDIPLDQLAFNKEPISSMNLLKIKNPCLYLDLYTCWVVDVLPRQPADLSGLMINRSANLLTYWPVDLLTLWPTDYSTCWLLYLLTCRLAIPSTCWPACQPVYLLTFRPNHYATLLICQLIVPSICCPVELLTCRPVNLFTCLPVELFTFLPANCG